MKNSIVINKKSYKMIAHRGLSGLERENTCAAFVAAGVKSYYGIETDVHVTKDKKFVICHDDNILRVTGVDRVIENSNFSDIASVPILNLDNTNRSDLVFPIPEDYFSICKKYNKIAVFELKNQMERDDIIRLMDIISNANMLENTIFISFSKENIRRLRKLNADIKIQFLTGDATDETIEFLKENDCGLDIYYKSLTKEYVQKVHDAGFEVNCWTCDNAEDANALIEMGVDYVTSNILE